MNSEFVCKQCGHVGEPITQTPGNTLTELILWLFMVIPGLIYSLWRLTNKAKVCPSCKSKEAMIPANSPVGKRMIDGNKPSPPQV